MLPLAFDLVTSWRLPSPPAVSSRPSALATSFSFLVVVLSFPLYDEPLLEVLLDGGLLADYEGGFVRRDTSDPPGGSRPRSDLSAEDSYCIVRLGFSFFFGILPPNAPTAVPPSVSLPLPAPTSK